MTLYFWRFKVRNPLKPHSKGYLEAIIAADATERKKEKKLAKKAQEHRIRSSLHRYHKNIVYISRLPLAAVFQSAGSLCTFDTYFFLFLCFFRLLFAILVLSMASDASDVSFAGGWLKLDFAEQILTSLVTSAKPRRITSSNASQLSSSFSPSPSSSLLLLSATGEGGRVE
jgi:hypothetical protein